MEKALETGFRTLLKYVSTDGKCPFDEWNHSLKDHKTRAIVATRLNRVIQGNFGLCRKLDDKIWELKIDYGPGFRIYFAEVGGQVIVLLLCGGNKTRQYQDIDRARRFFKEYEQE